MLGLVPLAGPGRVVTHGDGHAEVIGQLLQVILPGAVAAPIAPAAVRAQQQCLRPRIAAPPEEAPPAAEALYRKLRRVVAHAHVDEALVALDVVGAVRDGGAYSQAGVVVDIDMVGLPLRAPGPPSVLERAHAFLLLRVDRQNRLAALEEPLDLGVDVPKLLVPPRGRGAFLRLQIRLEGILPLPEPAADRVGADRMSPARQLFSDAFRRLAGPAEETHRVAGRRFVHDFLDRTDQLRISHLQPLPASARLTHPPARAEGRARLEFAHSPQNRGARHARQRVHRLQPAPAQREGFSGDEPPGLRFVECAQHPEKELPLRWHISSRIPRHPNKSNSYVAETA